MLNVGWQEFSRYLFIERKLDTSCTTNYQGRFKVIDTFFTSNPFTKEGVTLFFETLLAKKLKNGTLNNYLKLLKHITHYQNQTFLDDYSYFKRETAYIDVLTGEEIDSLIKAMQGRFAVATEVIARTGIRVGELTALTWNDFKGDRLILRDTKNNEMRQVPLLPDLSKKVASLPKHKKNFIFGTVNGAMSRVILNERMQEAARKVGITKKVGAHILRHSWITLSLSNDASLAKVSKMAGHKSVTSTMHYEHMIIDDLFSVAELHPLSTPFLTSSAMIRDIKKVLDKYKRSPIKVESDENTRRLVVTIKKTS